jgi:hypothetical protein
MTEYSVNQDGSCHICSVIVEMTDYICSLSRGFWVLISKGPDAEKNAIYWLYCYQVCNNYLVLPMECRNDWRVAENFHPMPILSIHT